MMLKTITPAHTTRKVLLDSRIYNIAMRVRKTMELTRCPIGIVSMHRQSVCCQYQVEMCDLRLAPLTL